MLQTITGSEKQKYESIWSIDEYKQVSPGEQFVGMFWNIARPKRGQTILDVGCGAGAASVALKKRGLTVSGFDLTDQAWKHDDIMLHTGSIWHGLPKGPYDYAYCCDVMEHIPTQFVGLCISRMLEVSPRVFFSICFLEDTHGRHIGETLHLTVRDYVWWRDTMRELGNLLEARDLQGEGCYFLGSR